MEDLLPQAYQTSEESPKCPAIAHDFKSLRDSFHPLGLQIDKGTHLPGLSILSGILLIEAKLVFPIWNNWVEV